MLVNCSHAFESLLRSEYVLFKFALLKSVRSQNGAGFEYSGIHEVGRVMPSQ